MAASSAVRLLFVSGLVAPSLSGLALLAAPQVPAPSDVTFTPAHRAHPAAQLRELPRPDGVAPMPLRTYEEVRPWARAIKQRTGLGPRAGVMPPWYVGNRVPRIPVSAFAAEAASARPRRS